MREVVLRPLAQLDLESMYLHIAVSLGAPKAAQGLLDELYEAFDRISQMPAAGMVFADDDLQREYRRVLVKSYWVYYSFNDESVVVWRVFHTRQDIATQTIVDL